MGLRSIARLPIVICVAIVAMLGSSVVASSAATATRVTCSSVSGVADAKDPGIITGCTHASKTGGKGKVVIRDGSEDVWHVTWAGKHGTTVVRMIHYGFDKKHKCAKGWFAFTESGKVTGGSGPAHTVIPKGQTVSAHFCGNVKTGEATLWKGTKLVL